MKNNSKLFKYLQELESTLYKHIKENPSLKDGFSDVFLFNELFYAYYYLNTQQPQRAYEHLVKAKEYQNENNYFMYQVLYFDTYARYYKYIGEYQKSLRLYRHHISHAERQLCQRLCRTVIGES